MTTHDVTIELRFWALGPQEGEDGDAWADRIGDSIVETLKTHTPVGIYDQSISITDWTDKEVEPDDDGD